MKKKHNDNIKPIHIDEHNWVYPAINCKSIELVHEDVNSYGNRTCIIRIPLRKLKKVIKAYIDKDDWLV